MRLGGEVGRHIPTLEGCGLRTAEQHHPREEHRERAGLPGDAADGRSDRPQPERQTQTGTPATTPHVGGEWDGEERRTEGEGSRARPCEAVLVAEEVLGQQGAHGHHTSDRRLARDLGEAQRAQRAGLVRPPLVTQGIEVETLGAYGHPAT
ncbi:MAG: hypothetical protein ACO3CC_16455, partial [Alphaproteobacteria bacterium]